MNNDLISRSELKKAFSNNCVHNCYYCNLAKWDKKGACYNCGLIDNAPTVEGYKNVIVGGMNNPYNAGYMDGIRQAYKELERQQGEWIPIKYRPLTGEERVKFSEYWGIEYCDTLSEVAFDCPMPEDGQRILISTKYGVDIDTCSFDPDEGYALEDRGDWDGVEAWMSLPNSYERSDEE